MDIDPTRRNKKPRLLLESERERLDEFIDSIHYSARYETAYPAWPAFPDLLQILRRQIRISSRAASEEHAQENPHGLLRQLEGYIEIVMGGGMASAGDHTGTTLSWLVFHVIFSPADARVWDGNTMRYTSLSLISSCSSQYHHDHTFLLAVPLIIRRRPLNYQPPLGQ